jgi:hypothetical protein
MRLHSLAKRLVMAVVRALCTRGECCRCPFGVCRSRCSCDALLMRVFAGDVCVCGRYLGLGGNQIGGTFPSVVSGLPSLRQVFVCLRLQLVHHAALCASIHVDCVDRVLFCSFGVYDRNFNLSYNLLSGARPSVVYGFDSMEYVPRCLHMPFERGLRIRPQSRVGWMVEV